MNYNNKYPTNYNQQRTSNSDVENEGISIGKKILFFIFLILLLAPASIFLIFNFVSPPTKTQIMYNGTVIGEKGIQVNANICMQGESEKFEFLSNPNDPKKDSKTIYKPKVSLSVADEGNYDKNDLNNWVRFDSDRLKLVWTADFVTKGSCDFILSISKGGYKFDDIKIDLIIGYQKITILGESILDSPKPIVGQFVESNKYVLCDEGGQTSSPTTGWSLINPSSDATNTYLNNGGISFDSSTQKIKFYSINNGIYEFDLFYKNDIKEHQATLHIKIIITEYMKIKSNYLKNPDGVEGLVVRKDPSSNDMISDHSPTPIVLDRDDHDITNLLNNNHKKWRIEPTDNSNVSDLVCDEDTGVITWPTNYTTPNQPRHEEFNLIVEADNYFTAIFSTMIDYKIDAIIEGGSNTLEGYGDWDSVYDNSLNNQYTYKDVLTSNDLTTTSQWTINTYQTPDFILKGSPVFDRFYIAFENNKANVEWVADDLVSEEKFIVEISSFKNGYWIGQKTIEVTLKPSIVVDFVPSTPSPTSILFNLKGIPDPADSDLPGNSYDPTDKSIIFNYFHGMGGDIQIPISTLPTSPAISVDSLFKLRSIQLGWSNDDIASRGITISNTSDTIKIEFADDIVDNNANDFKYSNSQDSDFQLEIYISQYGFNKETVLKLNIFYYANWFQGYPNIAIADFDNPNKVILAPAKDVVTQIWTPIHLNPIDISAQPVDFYTGQTPSNKTKFYYKRAEHKHTGALTKTVGRTPNTHLSNFYGKLANTLGDNYFADFTGDIFTNFYLKLPDNITKVGNNFCRSIMNIVTNNTTHANPISNVNFYFPKYLYEVGDNFFNYACTGTAPATPLYIETNFINALNYSAKFHFNDDFTFPQTIAIAGDGFLAHAFTAAHFYHGIVSSVIQLPQNISDIGSNAFDSMFSYSQGDSVTSNGNENYPNIEAIYKNFVNYFTLPETFTLPQGLTFLESAPNMFLSMFAHSSLKKIPDNFQLPQNIEFFRGNVIGDYKNFCYGMFSYCHINVFPIGFNPFIPALSTITGHTYLMSNMSAAFANMFSNCERKPGFCFSLDSSLATDPNWQLWQAPNLTSDEQTTALTLYNISKGAFGDNVGAYPERFDSVFGSALSNSFPWGQSFYVRVVAQY